jgi:pimeloyl-ACP methyl ester carboxylesterase
VPVLTELEWAIRPQLQEWAEAASYDAPGVGGEPPPPNWSLDAIVGRGLEEIERRGWSDCVVVGDEFGTSTAIHLAARRPEVVTGLALGHPTPGYVRGGPRQTLNREVMHSFTHLLEVDYKTYARHYTQLTKGAFDDEAADAYVRRVPQDVARSYSGTWVREAGDLAGMVHALDVPLLLARHEDCLGWTDESWEDAVSAFPEAETVSCSVKPSASEQFLDALRAFCGRLERDLDGDR